jgi:hypothetical protein
MYIWDVCDVCDERLLCEEGRDVNVLLRWEKEICVGLRRERDSWEGCGYDLFDPSSPFFHMGILTLAKICCLFVGLSLYPCYCYC